MRRVLLLAALLSGCDISPQWQGWVYPHAGDLTEAIEIGRFRTFDQCEAAAVGVLRSLPNPDGGDYECGRSCRRDMDLQINVCAETR